MLFLIDRPLLKHWLMTWLAHNKWHGRIYFYTLTKLASRLSDLICFRIYYPFYCFIHSIPNLNFDQSNFLIFFIIIFSFCYWVTTLINTITVMLILFTSLRNLIGNHMQFVFWTNCVFNPLYIQMNWWVIKNHNLYKKIILYMTILLDSLMT